MNTTTTRIEELKMQATAAYNDMCDTAASTPEALAEATAHFEALQLEIKGRSYARPGGTGQVYLTNLTPHAVTLINEDGKVLNTWGSAGIPRVTTKEIPVIPFLFDAHIDCYIPIVAIEWGEIEGLPEPETDRYGKATVYIVSRIVADAAKAQGRTDCVVPNNIVRDDKGVIIGCRGFAI